MQTRMNSGGGVTLSKNSKKNKVIPNMNEIDDFELLHNVQIWINEN